MAASAAWLLPRQTADPEPEFVPAIAAVSDAASRSPVVLIGEIHQWEELHRFLRALVRDPRLARTVDDIVVEFGNARFQSLVDAYVGGKDVSYAAVSQAWTETTQEGVWSTPDYAAFFRTVREANRATPSDQRLRVLLGDPPIDRSKIDGPAELDHWILQRDTHFARVIQREVLTRDRRAIVIAGIGHVLRQPSPYPTLTNLLEGRVKCTPDPVAVAAGINWCDELQRYSPTPVHVIVPHLGPSGNSRLEERIAAERDTGDCVRWRNVARPAATGRNRARGVKRACR